MGLVNAILGFQNQAIQERLSRGSHLAWSADYVQAPSREILVIYSGLEDEGRGNVHWLPWSSGRMAVRP